MQIQPLFDRVLVMPQKQNQTTKSGITLPYKSKQILLSERLSKLAMEIWKMEAKFI